MLLEDRVAGLLRLPRHQQIAAWRALLADAPPPAVCEDWNTAFGPGSLFDAWTQTTIAQQVYDANRQVIRTLAQARGALRIVEIGAGDGALWRGLPDLRGVLVVVDPAPDALTAAARHVPAGLQCRQVQGQIQDVPLPDADLIVCSLTLHHVAGRDAAERAGVGLTGPGKTEVIARLVHALRAQDGVGLLNEADVSCDVTLPPGETLREHLFDSYVRRCGAAICDDLRERRASPDLRARWRAMLHRWFLAQPNLADASVVDRDVYELRVTEWLAVLAAGGARVSSHRFTDPHALFHQYVFQAN